MPSISLVTVIFSFALPTGIIVAVTSSTDEAVKVPGKLIFAQILYRHGDRTPIKPYPTDPYGNNSYWPVEFGQLTDVGRQQQYNLGRWLRTRYNTLIGETYSKNEIYVLSTNVNRTIMSAKANLAGLYESLHRKNWDDVVNIEKEDEKVLAMKRQCPAYENALHDLKHSDEFKIVKQRYHAVFKYLSQHTGKLFQSVESVQSLYSVLQIEDMNNFELPAWTDKVYPEPLKSLSARSFATSTYTRQLARLKAGPLFKSILQRFKDKSQATLNPSRSLWIYSAHDNTVANLLNTLNIFDWHNPPFCATVLLEMRKHKGNNIVSVFYKNETIKQPYLLNIPNCGPSCPLNRFIEIYSDVLPHNGTDECFYTPHPDFLTSEQRGEQLSTVVLSFLSVVVLILIALHAYTKKRQSEYLVIESRSDNYLYY